MNRRYYFLTALILLLAGGLLLLPQRKTYQERSPEELLRAINNTGRFVSSDQIAARIIAADPSLLLIDVRDSLAYDAFSLDASVNIPLDKLLDDQYFAYIHARNMDLVFFSNGDIKAEKAWISAFREGAENIFILQGGLNNWVETILKPQKPGMTASSEELELYDFRRAACLYFKGGIVEMEGSQQPEASPATAVRKQTRKPVVVQPHPQEEDVDGGC